MSHSVSILIAALKDGDRAAVNALAARYFDELVRMASRHLRAQRVSEEEGEDIAIVALMSFFKAAQGRGHQKLTNCQDMRNILNGVARNKVNDARKREQAQKRGHGKVRPEAALNGSDDTHRGLDQFAAAQITPDDVVAAVAEVSRLLDLLDEEELRSVALMKMEDYKNREIAAALDLSESTVERKLKRIRMIWQSKGYGLTDD